MKSMLRATALMSSTAFISLLFSLIKGKVFAVLLGVSGVGLLGILMSVYGIGASIGGIATGGSVVKEVAELVSVKSDRIAVFKQAVINLCLLISAVIFFIMVVFRPAVSDLINYNLTFWDSIFIGVAIFFSNLSGLQLSWLNANGAIKKIAFVKTIGSFLTLIISVAILWIFGNSTLALLVLLPPFLLTLFSSYYSRDARLLSDWNFKKLISGEVIKYQKQILKVGAVLMLASLIASVVNLLVRVIVEEKFGIEGVGLFQSAWSVSMTYIEILLASVSVYFFPVLISKIRSLKDVSTLLNEQIEQLLFICLPVIFATFVFSKLVLIILFNASFTDALNILRWQLLGDIFKIWVWVFGYVLIAYNKLLAAIIVQLIWGLVYVGAVYFSSDYLGVESSGFGFFLAYACLFLVYIFYLKAGLNISINTRNLSIIIVASIIAGTILYVAHNYSETITIIYGLFWIAISLFFSIHYINKKTSLISKLWKGNNL